MIEFIIFIIIVIILVAIFSKPAVKSGEYKIDVVVPNPEKCSDKTMIDFIANTPNDKLTAVFKEYTNKHLLIKKLYIDACYQKLIKGSINVNDYYLKIDSQEVAPKYKEVELPIEKPSFPEDRREKPISIKKWADDKYQDKREFTPEDFLRFKTNKIDSEYLKPTQTPEIKNHQLYGKKTVITGSFEKFPFRNELAYLLWSAGADVDTAITKNTNYVIVGDNPGDKKLEQINEFNITVIDQENILDMFPNYKPKFSRR